MPGPDYHLYLAPAFVDDGVGFLAIRAEPRQIGAVKAFENFALDLPPDIDLGGYDAVVVWCERPNNSSPRRDWKIRLFVSMLRR